MKNQNIVQTGIRMPVNLHKELRKQANHKGISQNALILQILWEWKEDKIQK